MTQHYLRHINIEQVISHIPGMAGVSLSKILGQSAVKSLQAKPNWNLVTPVNARDQAITQSKFFKSIVEHVNDPRKQSAFLTSMVALFWAQQQKNLPEYLAGQSSPLFKVASKLKFQGVNLSIHELKPNNKDRVYLQTHSFGGDSAVILYLAHHKKDQTTPQVVKGYCHDQASKYFSNQSSVVFLKD